MFRWRAGMPTLVGSIQRSRRRSESLPRLGGMGGDSARWLTLTIGGEKHKIWKNLDSWKIIRNNAVRARRVVTDKYASGNCLSSFLVNLRQMSCRAFIINLCLVVSKLKSAAPLKEPRQAAENKFRLQPKEIRRMWRKKHCRCGRRPFVM